MTTIDPNRPVLNPVGRQQRTDRSEQPKGTFADVWRETVASSQRSEASADSPASMASIRPTQFAIDSPASADGIADRAQQLLETMEIYQQQLMDGKATLRDIQPTIEKMAIQSRSLGEDAVNADATGELKSIVDQSLSLATMEIARFYSGDYNDG